jgi:hypothetical protein
MFPADSVRLAVPRARATGAPSRMAVPDDAGLPGQRGMLSGKLAEPARAAWKEPMPVRFQLVIDCAGPDRLARFWAAALGYELEPPPAGFSTWDDYYRDLGILTSRVPTFVHTIGAC